MSAWRAVLVIGLALLLAASVMAFVTLSVPAMRSRPGLGLVASAVVFLVCIAGVAVALRRRK